MLCSRKKLGWSVDSDQVAIGELVTPGYEFINVPHPNDNNGGIGIVHHKYLKISDLLKEIWLYFV